MTVDIAKRFTYDEMVELREMGYELCEFTFVGDPAPMYVVTAIPQRVLESNWSDRQFYITKIERP